jgi:NADPH-dependent 2,4-dienoyl-CoA reductase/sulfur reductase-like enzyme
LLATGAEPIELTIPGSGIEHIHYLRTLSDSEKIIAASKNVKTAVIIGASFIGLEVAAALRKRGLEIHVVAPEAIPMARILGPEIGRFILKLHQDHGVIFHLEDSVTEIAPHKLILKSGDSIETNLVIIGVGVKPNLKLAEQAGLSIDKGVLVNGFLETSAPDIYAAGDIARWPDKITGENIRVEHWTVAERQGQIAAKNMLGAEEPFDIAPFFWSQHYDQTISYVGHAASWNRSEISGDPITGSCAVTYFNNDKKLAVATLGRDIQNLCAEISFEKEIRNIK